MTYGLIGEKLSHSFSKLIHEKLGDYQYTLFSLNEEQFKKMLTERNFDGVNITIPYKKTAMSFCDEISEIAKEIGAINTIYKKDGNFVGTNTDYDGFLYMVKRANMSLKNKKVLILGVGGTSLTVQKCACNMGARKISVAYRGHDFELDKDAEIIVNTTPVGMFPNNGDKIIDLADFPKCEGVLDVVYNPLLTELLLRAKEYGIPYSGGLPMLVAQATAAANLFRGRNYEADRNCEAGDNCAVGKNGDAGENYEDRNEEILNWLLESIKNIVLIGMPGSGKSTTGKILAKELNKTFIDTDEIIALKAGMSIPEIFAKHGEAFFRNLETEVCKEYGKQKNLVIATGGGAILKKENMDALLQNGETFFLNRNIKNLETAGRPLSANFEAIQKLYEERLPLYKKYSDHTIDCTEAIAESKNGKNDKITEVTVEAAITETASKITSILQAH